MYYQSIDNNHRWSRRSSATTIIIFAAAFAFLKNDYIAEVGIQGGGFVLGNIFFPPSSSTVVIASSFSPHHQPRYTGRSTSKKYLTKGTMKIT
mmetsp:Transcript_22421/g.41520  ORF Transcript_22421/g.41520 Transcript_22421/m.41520 type:complete len:93 (+) Transcript_22421:65-343(+)